MKLQFPSYSIFCLKKIIHVLHEKPKKQLKKNLKEFDREVEKLKEETLQTILVIAVSRLLDDIYQYR